MGRGDIGRPCFSVTIGNFPSAVRVGCGARARIASAILPRILSSSMLVLVLSPLLISGKTFSSAPFRFKSAGTRANSDFDTGGDTSSPKLTGITGFSLITEATLADSLAEVIFGSTVML